MYHAGNRELQDRFGSAALADRLVEKTHRTGFTEGDVAFIQSLPFFFLATADAEQRRRRIVTEASITGKWPWIVFRTGRAAREPRSVLRKG